MRQALKIAIFVMIYESSAGFQETWIQKTSSPEQKSAADPCIT